jgi:hypothetical protein
VAPNFSRLPSTTGVSAAAALTASRAAAGLIFAVLVFGCDSAAITEDENRKHTARAIVARMIKSPLLSIRRNCRLLVCATVGIRVCQEHEVGQVICGFPHTRSAPFIPYDSSLEAAYRQVDEKYKRFSLTSSAVSKGYGSTREGWLA